jgi:hypothetical protein
MSGIGTVAVMGTSASNSETAANIQIGGKVTRRNRKAADKKDSSLRQRVIELWRDSGQCLSVEGRKF